MIAGQLVHVITDLVTNRGLEVQVVGVSYDDDIGLAVQTIERVQVEDSRVLGDPVPAARSPFAPTGAGSVG